MFWSYAWAQSTPQQPSMLESLLPMVLLFGVIYFFMIRPQSKFRKEQAKMQEALKRGDQVITVSGILGRVEGLTDKYITLEIATDVRVKILRTQIAGQVKDQPA
ncbi:MAG: preprotein translocase subunit YajC [Bdellovibrionales bacterium CG10_big_fil_rev_8_21_14_0_10_45_34]|nr:MAG: preprotein translocase subunit YajC [Bdellovibrionales bacterium CG10_big_fil_rev_8_21_14_0_10_45_34]